MVKYMDNNAGFNQWMANKQKAASAVGAAKTSKFTGFLWWLAIFAVACWLFSMWFAPKQELAVSNQESVAVEDISNMPLHGLAGRNITIGVQGLRFPFVRLNDYTEKYKVPVYSDETKNKIVGKETVTEQVVLFSYDDKGFIEVGLVANGTTAPTMSTKWKEVQWPHSKEFGKPAVMTWTNADNVNFTRAVLIDDYVITIKDEISNKSGRDVSVAPYARVARTGGAENVAVETGGIAYVNSDIENVTWKKLAKKPQAYQTVGGFVGFADQYWETLVSVDSPDQTIRMKKIDELYQADTAAAPVQIAAGKTAAVTTRIFAGPRDPSVLAHAIGAFPGIRQTIDYGWFWFLSRPLLWSLNAIHGFVLNYGLAIILLTIALRVLMWPLTRKSYTSMAAMQKMQPELQRIQKLYANDKARQQMEMMKLYQTHKTSPMSGCLPMLLQIPIFFGLYKALLISVPMRGAEFLWVSDLSVMDPFFILPLLMGATMWWQQNLQTATQSKSTGSDPMASMQKVMKWMPVIFTFMFAWMPAGLVLYWTVSNLFGIGQMYVIKRKK
ncbi:MAG: membrane protein insertase YidC [Rickettsiales bacterium]|jgi:YidC/Oxa1 family membrane protein insertase|nr:membrane protein insertase YidC [Rickettsiales bacterium]